MDGPRFLSGWRLPGGWKPGAAILTICLVCAVAVLFAADSFGQKSGPAPVVSSAVVQETTATTTPVAAATTATAAINAGATTTSSTRSSSTTSTTLPLFTKQHPLRILEVGDSLATYPGYALENVAKMYTGIQVESITKQSSGLVYPAYYNWPQVLAEAVAGFHPHVTVVLLGANDGQGMAVDGHAFALFSDTWSAEYANRIDRFIEISTAAGATVIWVGLPIMRNGTFSETERRMNEFYEAACARHRGVVFIDGYALFADAAGKYADSLADSTGKTSLMRARDGIHFTMTGADRIAQAVVGVLLQRYRLERAAPQQPAAAPQQTSTTLQALSTASR